MKILSPLIFLKVNSLEIIILNWILPIAASLALTYFCMIVPHQLNIFGNEGFIKSINGLLAILVGFFIAALTAAVSFPVGNLDKQIAGIPLYLPQKKGKRPVLLTRRRFLCLLFGFNAFSSLFIYLAGEFAYLFAENIKDLLSVKELLSVSLVSWAKTAFLLLYFFGLANLCFTTLLGLHYLTDRMHRT